MRQYLLTHHPMSPARVWFSPRSCSPQCPSRQALHQRGEAVNMAVGRSTTLIIARPYLIWEVGRWLFTPKLWSFTSIIFTRCIDFLFCGQGAGNASKKSYPLPLFNIFQLMPYGGFLVKNRFLQDIVCEVIWFVNTKRYLQDVVWEAI